MDIPRPPRRTALRRTLSCAAAGVALIGSVAFVAQLEPHLPVVERADIWTATVERGPFVVRVRGSGTLRPESIRWLTTESSGRIEEVLVKPGMPVELSTPVVRLENLDLRLQAVQAARDVQVAQAQVLGYQRQSREDELQLSAELVGLRTALEDAERRAVAYTGMQGTIVSRLDGEATESHLAEIRQREALAGQRLRLLEEMAPRQLLGLERQVREGSRVQQVRDELVERLIVRASARGILQDVLVELGQWVVPGTAVAKVIVSKKLQAELRIPAEQAGPISVGQAAQIRTGFGPAQASNIQGRVRRVAPAASEGTVTVEIALEGELPDNARPEQNVEGNIEVEHTASTLHVTRPVGLALGDITNLFRVDPASGVATRVAVRTGRMSVDSVEVLSGLEAGDEVISSDMSRFANLPAVRLE